MTKKLTQRYLIIETTIRTFLIATVISLVLTSLVVSVGLFSSGKSATVKMVDSLQDTFVHVTPNTDAWVATAKQGPSTSYVQIDVAKTATTRASVFESTGTTSFLQKSQQSLGKIVRYVHGDGLYFYETRHTQKATYHVWLKIDYLLNELAIILITVLAALLFSALLGVVLIGRTSRRISQPLVALTDAVTSRTANLKTANDALPVPKSPAEVEALAQRFNQLLRALNDELLQEQRFVSDASHELRTPLSVIRGYVMLLKRRGKDHPELFDEAVNFLDSETQRLTHLVESLLTITRNEKLNLALTPVNVAELFSDVLPQYGAQLTQTLDVAIDPAVTVRADADSLKQIVLALIENASKYSPAESTISVSAKQEPIGSTLQVRDTGVGIPDDEKAKIFDRFYRVDEARSSEIPGTGLGLAIVSQLAALNHATIAVTDNQPQGTVFTLTFPAL